MNKVMNSRFFLLFLVVFLSLISCKKDELTLPARFYFTFDLESHHDTGVKSLPAGSNANPPFGRLSIESGEMVISAIEFDGKREQGKDVYFISDFEAPLVIGLEEKANNPEIGFDIPQGSYKKMDISFHLGGKDTNGIPSLTLAGDMVLPNSQIVSVKFEYHFDDIIVVRSRGNNPNQNILLRKDIASAATVNIDVPFLFRFINMGELMSGQFVQQNGNDVLLINQQYNKALFNKLSARLSNAFTVVVN